MNCAEAKSLVHAYFDGELDAAHQSQVEQHLRDCEACTGFYESQRVLQSSLRSEGLYFTAPADLSHRVRAVVRNAEAPHRRRWMALAAAAVIAVFIVTAIVSNRVRRDDVAQELVASHVRSLMAAHLTDVPSSDQHTVKPWFNGKLDFAPPVFDFKTEGFPLAGGRLDYVANRPVAALVYRHGGHVINLFIWPSTAKADSFTTLNGYNVVSWTQRDVSFHAVSDLNAADLDRFTRMVRASAAR
jgi:anti-sigma factor RsiW